jgi:hypothetical protein
VTRTVSRSESLQADIRVTAGMRNPKRLGDGGPRRCVLLLDLGPLGHDPGCRRDQSLHGVDVVRDSGNRLG